MPSTGSPLGSTPFGVGTPAVAQDPPTEQTRYTRYLNPGSRDYELDGDTGNLKQMPGVRQRMLVILLTAFRSSTTLPGMGIELPRKIDASIVPRMRDAVRRAYRQLTDVERVVRLNDILVSREGSGRLRVTIAYTDLTEPDARPDTISRVV